MAKLLKPKEYKVPREGPYDVHFMKSSDVPGHGTYSRHEVYVDHAISGDDAVNQAKGTLSSAGTIIQTIVIFLGVCFLAVVIVALVQLGGG